MNYSRLICAVLVVAGCASSPPRERTIELRITTELGEITAELYPDRAPGTVANFLRYVDAGHFDGGRFHRTVHMNNQPADSIRIEVIQASVDTARRRSGWPAIPLERTSVTNVKHEDGTLSMARGGSADSATSAFFICIGPQPSLDFGGKRNPDGQGFAAFGKVTRGMDIVRRIQRSPAQAQTLTPVIRIVRIQRT